MRENEINLKHSSEVFSSHSDFNICEQRNQQHWQNPQNGFIWFGWKKGCKLGMNVSVICLANVI